REPRSPAPVAARPATTAAGPPPLVDWRDGRAPHGSGSRARRALLELPSRAARADAAEHVLALRALRYRPALPPLSPAPGARVRRLPAPRRRLGGRRTAYGRTATRRVWLRPRVL